MSSAEVSGLSASSWVVAAPRLVWDAYVHGLWDYTPGSWVARTASTFHVLAVLVILPMAILTLLDVTSYVIARTLGIVDAVKASTSDIAEHATITTTTTTAITASAITDDNPTLVADVTATTVINAATTADITTTPVCLSSGAHLFPCSSAAADAPVPASLSPGGADASELSGQEDTCTALATSCSQHRPGDPTACRKRGASMARPRGGSDAQVPSAAPSYFAFAGEEDVQLAGVGVFSPAVSQPGSPSLSRASLNMRGVEEEQGGDKRA